MYKLMHTAFFVDKMSLKNNQLKPGNFQLKPFFTRETGKLSDNEFFTKLTLILKNEEQHPFPVDLEVVFRAIFRFENIEDEKNVSEFLKLQAVHIMYPYLRSIVSNLTTTGMMPPIILPITDVSTLFDNKPTTIQ